MSVEFIGFISNNNSSETIVRSGPVLDVTHIEAVAKAHELAGFARALVACHSTTPDALQISQHVLGITRKLKVMLAQRPGFTAPTLLARQLATLDQLSGGRVSLHVITGGNAIELRQDGNTLDDKDERYARTGEFLDIVRAEWTSEQPFDYDGKYYKVEKGFSQVKPYHPGGIYTFVGGGSDAAIEVAAKHADTFALWGESYAQVRDVTARVRAAAARYGRPTPRFSLSVRPILADTEEKAWAKANDILDRAVAGGRRAMSPLVLAVRLVLGFAVHVSAQTTLRVGDQKGNSQAVMEAAGVLKDIPYKIEWKEFPAAAPLLEALGAGAIETGLVGDAPFTFAAAANVPVKAIAAVRQSRDGLAVLVPEHSPIKSFDDLRGKKIATGRGSIGHQLILAAIEARGWKPDDVQIAFLAPSDAKVAYTQGSVDAWSTWEPYVSQEEVMFKSRRVITGEGLTPGLGFQVATPNAIRDKRPELEDFVRRLAAARAWSAGNVGSYAATWGKLMNIPTSVPLNWLTRPTTRTS